MEYVSKREINREVKRKKYLEIYDDVKSGLSWKEIAKKYKYRSVSSIKAVYYAYIVPLIKNI